MPTLPSEFTATLPAAGADTGYASRLLNDLGFTGIATDPEENQHPARRWADCGLMYLTGNRDGPPEICPVPLPSCADGALNAFRALVNKPILPQVDGAQLLTERAAITGYRRNGSGSLQDHCQLLSTADGEIGLNLARHDDWELVPAWLQQEDVFDWQRVAHQVRGMTTGELVAQGRLLGLAVVDAATWPTDTISRDVIPKQKPGWFSIVHRAEASAPNTGRPPRVVDLSSLWAGPLCSQLWQLAGAEVIKVESSQRPDGARLGSPEFFDLLNQGKESVVLELHTASGRRQLLDLIQQADMVLEASRPRALRQMGIIAEDIMASHPALSWISITGYGRAEPQANWVAYGDDAGVAAGLSTILHDVSGEWLICGDAIADPLTGMHAALAGWAAWLSGGGQLIELSLEQTVRHCITATAPRQGSYGNRYRRWQQYLADNRLAAQPPQRRTKAPLSVP